ncbi:hypothetical protein CPB84DRAFT_1776800 [Gymnopilus junonius]|uniref:Uncharacterized protein n=1 Tax=Gymnopilus junonius TaxID=109634 RepID=A0A9P5NRU3_GYMJU|nr:hypothetical protein CPB84DRAFT_1776800 [Gymnopilus junonius]
MVDHVHTTTDSVSSSYRHDYDDDDEYDKVLREFVQEEYFLPGPPSSAPLSPTPLLEQEIHPSPAYATHDVATGNYTEIDRGFHEAEDASASSPPMPSAFGMHSQHSQSPHPQTMSPETMALGNSRTRSHKKSDQAIMAGQTGSQIALGNLQERSHHQDDTRDGSQLSTPPPSSSVTPVGLVNRWSPSSAQSPPALSISKATHPADPAVNTSSPGPALSPAGSSSQQQKRKKEEDEQMPAPAPKKLKRPGKGQSAGPPTTQAVFMPVLHPKRLRQVLNYSSVPRGRPTDIFRIQTGQPTRGDWMTEEDEEYLESRKESSQ